ncbi:hypothetical protein SmJEL517_g03496 [Synchytrium microbalum]|uniref:Transforming acidic coiled-coil-containing protein C-terminal domain-containing protein n=1 Tax=Synchytrium microbalum TaxID=1806994 RepID=A0A507BWE5_9FUNG|nr:uncharacterized protein SmJEL517_g03496 [Synchytrium microbalum]TPX33680.1 hypothetical protein SmJEL517_g03496 [Synchytrium microbalum]
MPASSSKERAKKMKRTIVKEEEEDVKKEEEDVEMVVDVKLDDKQEIKTEIKKEIKQEHTRRASLQDGIDFAFKRLNRVDLDPLGVTVQEICVPPRPATSPKRRMKLHPIFAFRTTLCTECINKGITNKEIINTETVRANLTKCTLAEKDTLITGLPSATGEELGRSGPELVYSKKKDEEDDVGDAGKVLFYYKPHLKVFIKAEQDAYATKKYDEWKRKWLPRKEAIETALTEIRASKVDFDEWCREHSQALNVVDRVAGSSSDVSNRMELAETEERTELDASSSDTLTTVDENTQPSFFGKLLAYAVSSATSSPVSGVRTIAEEAKDIETKILEHKLLSPSPPKATPSKITYSRPTGQTRNITPSSFLQSPIRWGGAQNIPLAGYCPNLVPGTPVPELALSAEPQTDSRMNVLAQYVLDDDIDLGSDLVSSQADDVTDPATPRAITTMLPLSTPLSYTPNSLALARSVLLPDSPVIYEEDDTGEDDNLHNLPRPEHKASKESWIHATTPPTFKLSEASQKRQSGAQPSRLLDLRHKAATSGGGGVAAAAAGAIAIGKNSVDDFMNEADVTLLDEAPPFNNSRAQSDLYLPEKDHHHNNILSQSTSVSSFATATATPTQATPEQSPGSVANSREDNVAEKSPVVALSREFDPLATPVNNSVEIPSDWMSMTSSKNSVVESSNSTTKPSKANVIPTGALLDILASPASALKYSEKDLERVRQEMRLEFDREFELAQEEIRELEAERAAGAEQHRKIQATLAEWEQTMRDMIAESQREKETSHRMIEKQRLIIEQLKIDNAKHVKDNDRVALQAKQASVLLESSQKDMEDMKEKVDLLQHDLDIAQQRYDQLRAHAEAKLESANVEIAKVRANHDKEISAYRARISKAELNVSTLEQQVKTKTAENIELSRICDELVGHIQAGTPSE